MFWSRSPLYHFQGKLPRSNASAEAPDDTSHSARAPPCGPDLMWMSELVEGLVYDKKHYIIYANMSTCGVIGKYHGFLECVSLKNQLSEWSDMKNV